MTRNFIGCDLSRSWLDLHDPAGRIAPRCPNSASGIDRLVAGLGPDDILVFEATSGCDRLLRGALAAAGRAFVRLNPLHAWHFAQSLNLPKTDRVDAGMLARFGQERQPRPDAPSCPARDELAAFVQRRDQLKRMLAQEKNRLGGVAHRAVAQGIRGSIRSIDRQIAGVEALIEAHLLRHPDLAAEARLLRSIPGIGPVVATTLLAHMPELGRLDRRAAASLAGLAPKARESGRWRGTRHLGAGRRQVRRLMYMAALSALRRPAAFGGLGARMKAAGRPAKVILIALARKLLVVANAVLRDHAPYRDATAA